MSKGAEMSEDDFNQRRVQKNRVVLTLVLGLVAVIFVVTILKMQLH